MKHMAAYLALFLTFVAFATLGEDDKNHITISGSDVVRVYDGDTIYINIPNLPPVFGHNIGVRINGIDTPEMRSSCKADIDQVIEREMAKGAKQLIQDQIKPHSVVVLSDVKRDKYFRINATVTVDGVDVTQRLYDANLARPYDGGKKQGWCSK